MRSSTRLVAAIALVIVAGIFTGAQLGKLAPLVDWYRDDLGLSLVTIGWLTAVLGLFIALAAMPAGFAIDRFGLGATLRAGAVALGLGALALAAVEQPVLMMAARLVEALGYLALCIALPAILNVITPAAWRGPVLAVWSGFVPLGFALSDLLAGAVLPEGSPRLFLLLIALGFVLAALVLIRVLPALPPSAPATGQGKLRRSLSLPVILVTLSFGMIVVQSVATFAFLPAFVAGDGAHYLWSAGAIVLTVPLGNILAGALVRGRGLPLMSRLGVACFALSSLAALPAFTGTGPASATAAAIVLVVAGAIVASIQFASIPHIVPAGGSAAIVIGLICQAGGIGTLVGPPAAGWAIENFGWQGYAWFLAAAGVAGIAFMLPLALRRTSAQGRPA